MVKLPVLSETEALFKQAKPLVKKMIANFFAILFCSFAAKIPFIINTLKHIPIFTPRILALFLFVAKSVFFFNILSVAASLLYAFFSISSPAKSAPKELRTRLQSNKPKHLFREPVDETSKFLSQRAESSALKTPVKKTQSSADYSVYKTPKQTVSRTLPDTGSSKVNIGATSLLPDWTERLCETILDRNAEMINGREKKGSALYPSPPSSLPRFPAAEQARKVPALVKLDTNESLRTLGICKSVDLIIDNLHDWIMEMIIRPLSASIKECQREFSTRNLVHLSPEQPASYSLGSRNYSSINGSIMMMVPPSSSNTNSSYNPSSSAAANDSKEIYASSLLELSSRYPQHPLVLSRINIERYLAFANTGLQRSRAIRRIHYLSENPHALVTERWRNPLDAQRRLGSTSDNGDTQLIVHLFCTFMDLHLSSEQYHEQQPFTSRHWIGTGDVVEGESDDQRISRKLSDKPIYIQQCADGTFILRDNLTLYKADSFWMAVSMMVELVHWKSGGYLGIGNLATSTIKLTSILNTANMK